MQLTRRQALKLSTVLALASLTDRIRAETSGRIIYVLPLGKQMPDREVAMVERALVAVYDIDVRVLSRVGLPKSAYYPPRKRYRAEKLLPVLEAALPKDGHRILGITGVDISTTKGSYPDWGVLGLANLSGTACVLSSFRCRREAKSPEHAIERFGKVAVHELGHTFGLSHCTSASDCLMQDGRGSVLTLDQERDLCPSCRRELGQRGYPLVENGELPWD